ncbi:cell division protein FtsW, lipid II flippase [Pseudobutyrivibrio sp. OR37]|uniref:FtsW/RodA/SpoVE family cell cycle protein n=1 Tax=Pseudobutyrivibrio sp. OR37 TaxID=1798186 RepID=UPI0008F2368F|nr:FtsW/RodA/SpoVE family cell cycle protein [Pseudobutyrivibrio sp. OR37]SFI02198.1 cell division protein FtsW, lipid II flippase [Pseudobutyrivibrio sp. OR37]
MINVLISFSRITILAFALVFTLIDIIQIFEYRFSEVADSIFSTIQALMVVLYLSNTSLLLFLVNEDVNYLLLLAGQLLLFALIGISLNKLTYPASKALINNMLFFLALSFSFLERLSSGRAIRQFVFAIVSFVIGILVVMIIRKIKNIESLMFVFAGLGILLLILVSLIGRVEYGAKLSLSFGNISIQPSEFVKLLYLFFISGCIVTYKDFRGFLFASIGSAIHVLILVFSRDLGTALIFLVAYVFLIFIAYKNYIVLILEIALASIGGVLAYSLFPHIQARFIAWSDPLSVVDDKGYQISQSLFAIGTGSWVGSGFTAGQPAKIPVVSKDFIFAAIAEELGTIAAICIILCLMCTCIQLFNVAFNCQDSFFMLVVNGIAIIFSIQTILNIGGVIKFIPSTGVTLPFVSYGGSSLLSMFICFYLAECSNDLYYIEDN